MSGGNVIIQGGSGSDTVNLTLSVTGTNTFAYAEMFANFVNEALGNGDSITMLPPGAQSRNYPGAPDPTIYLLQADTVGNDVFFVPLAGAVIDTVAGAHTVSGSAAGGDTVLVGGANASADYIANSAANLVIYVDGNNTYTATSADTGGDTVVAGAGHDTIVTGMGATTVNTGTGSALITLNDTANSGTFNDKVWIDDGHATVNASGAYDAVVATTEGQTINGGHGTLLAVVLNPNSDGTTAGNDVVNAGSVQTVAVYDHTSANTINAGAGILYVVNSASVTGNVNVGNSFAYVFGSSDVGITFGTQTDAAGAGYFVAGAGNELADGANATTSLYMFGGNDSVAGNDLLIGGSANDLLAAGKGSETLIGGGGANTFLIDSFSTRNGTLTIADFGASAGNRIVLTGLNAGDVQTLISGGTEVDGNYVVSLSNSLTITFDGLASGASLNGHIYRF